MLSFIEGRPPQALVDLLKNPPSEEKQKLLMQVNDYITELKNTVPTTPQPFQQALQEYVDQLKAAVQTVENGGIIQLRLNKTPPDIFSALSLLPQFRTALDQMEKILSSQPTIVPHLRSHLVQYKALLTALQKQHLLIAQIHQLDQDMVRDIPRNQYDNIKKTLSALPDQMREDLERLIGEVQRAKNEERQQRWEAAKQGLKTILLQAETAYQDEYTSLSRQIRPLQIWFQQAIRKYTQDERTHSDTLSTQLDTFGEAVDTLVAKSASTAQPNTVQRPWFEKLCRDYPSLQNLASDVAKDKAGLMRYTMDKFKRAYHLISIPRIWEGFARTAMQLVIQSYQ